MQTIPCPSTLTRCPAAVVPRLGVQLLRDLGRAFGHVEAIDPLQEQSYSDLG